jgi:hypothetical protein
LTSIIEVAHIFCGFVGAGRRSSKPHGEKRLRPKPSVLEVIIEAVRMLVLSNVGIEQTTGI